MDNRSTSTAMRCRSVCRSTTAIVQWSWKGQSFWPSRNWWCPAQTPLSIRRTITCRTRRSTRPIGRARCHSIENWSTAQAINESESDEGESAGEGATANFQNECFFSISLLSSCNFQSRSSKSKLEPPAFWIRASDQQIFVQPFAVSAASSCDAIP